MGFVRIRTAVRAGLLLSLPVGLWACSAEKVCRWQIHDLSRPAPTVITAGSESSQPPSDAVILFDGKDLSAWQSAKDGGLAKWKVENGYMEAVPEAGNICSKQSFGSCQLHIEWAVPQVAAGGGQHNGNSGVFLMGKYELQILDSYENPTYPDGQAGAIYGQKPPMVNVSRMPGQWQSYDIIFDAPVFRGKKVVRPAAITVLCNGVLIQNHWIIQGSTFHQMRPYYEPHRDKLPITLQEHDSPVRFRNIWIRPLSESAEE